MLQQGKASELLSIHPSASKPSLLSSFWSIHVQLQVSSLPPLRVENRCRQSHLPKSTIDLSNPILTISAMQFAVRNRKFHCKKEEVYTRWIFWSFLAKWEDGFTRAADDCGVAEFSSRMFWFGTKCSRKSESIENFQEFRRWDLKTDLGRLSVWMKHFRGRGTRQIIFPMFSTENRYIGVHYGNFHETFWLKSCLGLVEELVIFERRII